MDRFLKIDGFALPARKKRAEKMQSLISDYSETGRALLKQARTDGYRLKWGRGDGWSGQVDADKKLIVLNEEDSDGRLIETLVHECRHISQFSRGVEYGCGMYNIKDAIRFHRCKEADAEAVTAAVCHQIRVNSKEDSPWKEFASGRPFVARGLEKAIRNNNGSTVTPAMLRGAFNGWYEDERVVKAYEEHYIEKGILTECFKPDEKIENYFRKGTTSEKIVSAVCSYHRGGCYWRDAPSVLNEPHRLIVNESTVRLADRVLSDIEKMTGIKQNRSYRTLPIRQITTVQ